MRVVSPTFRLLGGLAGIPLLACGADDLLLPSAGQPAELRVVSGDLQEAQTGARLPDPLVVEAVDATGRPVVGSLIEFRFVASTAGAEVTPENAETNQAGRAVAQVRLGQAPGAHPVEATVASGPSGLRVRFVLTALSPPPAPPDPAPPPGGGGDDGEGGGDDDEDGGAGGGGGGGGGGGDDGGSPGGGGGDGDGGDDGNGGGGDDDDGEGRGGDDEDDDDDDDRDVDDDGDDDDDDKDDERDSKGKDGKGRD